VPDWAQAQVRVLWERREEGADREGEPEPAQREKTKVRRRKARESRKKSGEKCDKKCGTTRDLGVAQKRELTDGNKAI